MEGYKIKSALPFKIFSTLLPLIETIRGRPYFPSYCFTIVQRNNGKKLDDLDIVFEWMLLKHWIYLSTHTLSISTWHIFFHLSLFPTIFHENIFWGNTVFFLDGVFKVYRSGHQCVKKVTNLKTPSIWNVIFFILGHSQGIRILATKKREKRREKTWQKCICALLLWILKNSESLPDSKSRIF